MSDKRTAPAPRLRVAALAASGYGDALDHSGFDRMVRGGRRPWRSCSVAAWFVLVLAGLQAGPACAETSPFDKLIGRWVGEGRLGVRNGKTEQVKCRVTYLQLKPEDPMQHTIRCASAGGSVEVRSWVTHADGKLAGTWEELERKWKGEIEGMVTPRGFKVAVKGEDIKANMDIIVLGAKQVIEIQFIESSLIGLTLILEKG